MTTQTQTQFDTPVYARLADVPPAQQEGILSRLVTRHAVRVASTFRGAGCMDAEDSAIAEAYRTFSNLRTFCLDNPHTVAEIERFIVNRYYRFAPARVNRIVARNRGHATCSLNDLMDKSGDSMLPESPYGVPSPDMNEVDVLDLLAFLGVHTDWLYLFKWVAIQGLTWKEAVARVRSRRRIQFEEPNLRKRWSRLCEDLGPGVAAGLAGLPLDAFRLREGHWATKQMKEPKLRGR